ncbi:acyl-CoA thioester hydrolase/BAAT C-terminal domain-containing protein [Flavobacterium frigoris]|uniref:BAAT / Acyl-CoA thioester hydrolase C terminal n=1 Tax=Flavobacterium frigoris TaxID=229204 RepID=A0A1H9S5X7_FLAFI|nr:acyl-CoA thioester hydrolase/BAAT C-terminal domain-containing protein [Flavobacterium frigoris]SER80371.1 BAAT / Acyl-CoA thioester hydrolase C terminal [Flavobacterium frigoris]
MKIKIIIFAYLFLTINAFGQKRTAEDFGYKHIIYIYKNDKVDILIKSKNGEENLKKPLLFFSQGSLPKPLIKYSEQGDYPVFPFDTDSISQKYHLVIIGKPNIPLIADTKTLGKDFTYIDSSGNFPKEYNERNLLTYYVDRNIEIIKYLQKQPWVSKSKLVVAGHSEGSTIVAKMANISKLITHLIYSGGNPLGRIMSVIEESRTTETDSTKYAEENFRYWQDVVNNKMDMTDDGQGDTYRATFEFSIPTTYYMEKLKIPVLICYGTKDYSSPFNDYFRVDCILKNRKNFQFNAYIGTEHNFFPMTADNKPNFDIYNWDKVANDWLKWLNSN